MMNKMELKLCPFCGKKAVFIGVHDKEGNFKGYPGCEYESVPWRGLSYALHHEGWGDCIFCTDGADLTMGGMLFDTTEEAADAWNKRADTDEVEVVRCKDCVHRDREVYVCYRTSIQVDDNDYCSYGKRRAKD